MLQDNEDVQKQPPLRALYRQVEREANPRTDLVLRFQWKDIEQCKAICFSVPDLIHCDDLTKAPSAKEVVARLRHLGHLAFSDRFMDKVRTLSVPTGHSLCGDQASRDWHLPPVVWLLLGSSSDNLAANILPHCGTACARANP